MDAPPKTPGAATDSLLEHARDLEPRDAVGAIASYRAALSLDPASLEAHNALERLGARERAGAWMGINCVIHPEDDIFRFFRHHPASLNPIREYLADGWRTLAELMVLLEEAGRPLLDMGRVLEFAAGFGRFTRHLAPLLPGRLDCSDIVPDANRFLGEQFGVRAIASTHDPAALEGFDRYDLVFVLSLFTHLPPTLWAPWLRGLAGTVAPGGLLVFTTQNEDWGRENGVSFGPDGAHFIPSSESRALDPDRYGTTYLTLARVRKEVAAALPGREARIRPRAFWNGQDAVIVSS